MNDAAARPSLKKYLRTLAIRWASVAFLFSAVSGYVFLSGVTKRLEEARLRTTARAVTRAYRPMILNGQIRDAQAQIERSLELEKDETVVIRGKNLEMLYSPDGQPHPLACSETESVCWSGDSMTYLQPVFFGSDAAKELFGYVELNIQPRSEAGAIWSLVGTSAWLYFFLVIGFLWSVSRVSGAIKRALADWSAALRSALLETPDGVRPEIAIPYAEFSEAGALVGSLHGEVQRLRETVATEAHAKAQSSIVRGIGHDLKTPLSQFRKFFEVLLLKHGQNAEIDEPTVGRIKASCDRMGSLLREMRQMGRISEREDEPHRIDMAVEANAYLDTLEAEPDFPTKEIKIRRVLHAGFGFSNISPTQFYRVLDNLMKNALDATPSGGIIVVFLDYRDGRPFLIVGDSGDGIPAENLPKVFSPDFTTKSSRGTGLGLAIVRGICAEVGAEVEVENGRHGGAIFTVHFQGGIKISDRSKSFKKEVNL